MKFPLGKNHLPAIAAGWDVDGEFWLGFDTGPEEGAWLGVPTVDLPTKIAPASMVSTAALISPITSAPALSSTRSVTVMLP